MSDSSATATLDVEGELTTVFIDRYRELLEGVPKGEPTWVTTGGPEGGVYGTLADLSAEEASRDVAGTTIAAHAEHLRWAIELVNGYFDGRDTPASWAESWSVKRVDADQWDELRRALRTAGDRLLANLPVKHGWREDFAVNGALASYGHAAYHLGALRQLKKVVRAGLR